MKTIQTAPPFQTGKSKISAVSLGERSTEIRATTKGGMDMGWWPPRRKAGNFHQVAIPVSFFARINIVPDRQL